MYLMRGVEVAQLPTKHELPLHTLKPPFNSPAVNPTLCNAKLSEIHSLVLLCVNVWAEFDNNDKAQIPTSVSSEVFI